MLFVLLGINNKKRPSVGFDPMTFVVNVILYELSYEADCLDVNGTVGLTVSISYVYMSNFFVLYLFTAVRISLAVISSKLILLIQVCTRSSTPECISLVAVVLPNLGFDFVNYYATPCQYFIMNYYFLHFGGDNDYHSYILQ